SARHSRQPRQLWLVDAKEHGSYGAYVESVRATTGESPLSFIVRTVSLGAVRTGADRRERGMTAPAERAVRAALLRVFLVEQAAHMLISARTANEREASLLQLMAPLVISGQADANVARQWAEHTERLLLETM